MRYVSFWTLLLISKLFVSVLIIKLITSRSGVIVYVFCMSKACTRVLLLIIVCVFSSSLLPLLEHRADFSVSWSFTDGRTPWKGDQIIANFMCMEGLKFVCFFVKYFSNSQEESIYQRTVDLRSVTGLCKLFVVFRVGVVRFIFVFFHMNDFDIILLQYIVLVLVLRFSYNVGLDCY
jgi:hypothetical protein